MKWSLSSGWGRPERSMLSVTCTKMVFHSWSFKQANSPVNHKSKVFVRWQEVEGRGKVCVWYNTWEDKRDIYTHGCICVHTHVYIHALTCILTHKLTYSLLNTYKHIRGRNTRNWRCLAGKWVPPGAQGIVTFHPLIVLNLETLEMST